MDKIREHTFSCDSSCEQDVAAWVKKYFSGIYDVHHISSNTSEPLHFEDRGLRIFSYSLGKRRVSGKISAERDAAYISSNPSDIVSFSIIKSGQLTLAEEIEQNELFHIDYRKPCSFSSQSGYVEYGLSLSAASLTSLCGYEPDLPCGRMLKEGMSSLLASFIVFLVDSLPDMEVEDIPTIYKAIGNILAACIGQSPEAISAAHPQIMATQIGRIREYIHANIGNRELGVNTIAKHFGLSTRTLSRIFQHNQSSPNEYIMKCRLRAALIEIESARANFNAESKRTFSMKRLAHKYGFTDTSSFSRSFKNYHGISPLAAFHDPGEIVTRALPLDNLPPSYKELIGSLS